MNAQKVSNPRESIRYRGGVMLSVLALLLLFTSCAAPRYGELKRELRRGESVYARAVDSPEAFVDATSVTDTAGLSDLYSILRTAVQNNPGVRAAFERWRASVERIPQASAPQDPKLMFGHYFESVETRVGPQKQSVGLTQMFPWFGTLELKGDIAAHNALIAEQRFRAVEDQLYREVVAAYTDYYYLERSTAITAELIDLIRRAESVAQAKYRVGGGPYADVIRAQVELGRLEDRLIALKDEKAPILARLNAALNRSRNAPIPAPDSLPVEVLGMSDRDLIEYAFENNPGLQALDLMGDREERAISLAKRKYYPSFSLGVNYINTGEASMPGVEDSGKDPIVGLFAINIPIWHGSYGASVREAQARRRAAQLDRADRENAIGSQLERVLFSFHDAERKISLYRDALIPKARQSIEASSAGYESGEIGFIDFLDAERILLEFELAYDRAQSDQLKHLAEIRVLVGHAYQQLTEGEGDTNE